MTDLPSGSIALNSDDDHKVPPLSYEVNAEHQACIVKMQAAQDDILAEDTSVYLKLNANRFYQALFLICYVPSKVVIVIILGYSIASWFGSFIGVVGLITVSLHEQLNPTIQTY